MSDCVIKVYIKGCSCSIMESELNSSHRLRTVDNWLPTRLACIDSASNCHSLATTKWLSITRKWDIRRRGWCSVFLFATICKSNTDVSLVFLSHFFRQSSIVKVYHELLVFWRLIISKWTVFFNLKSILPKNYFHIIFWVILFHGLSPHFCFLDHSIKRIRATLDS